MKHICPAPIGDGLIVPTGWSAFLGACPDTCYVDCTYNHNGKEVKFKDPKYAKGSNYGTR
jgi:hypothetical protein